MRRSDAERTRGYLILVDPLTITEAEARQHKGHITMAVLVNLEELICGCNNEVCHAGAACPAHGVSHTVRVQKRESMEDFK